MGGIDAAIGSRLRALRQSRYMTLDQVAERIGVRAQQIQKYETGQNRVAAARLFEFARLFDVPLSAFYDSLDREAAAPKPQDSRGLQLAHEFDKLSEAQKRAVLSLVRSLSDPKDDKGQPYGT
jgi:transcriptional regulator with XRE-family HTH domain